MSEQSFDVAIVGSGTSSSKKKTNTLRLFIENPNGVAEYIVGIVPLTRHLVWH